MSVSKYLMMLHSICQVLSSSISNSSSFHPFQLPHLSPLLPKPKSEILTPNCSKSPLFTTQHTNNASPLPSSSQVKASNPSSTTTFEKARTETVDASTSTRPRPSSLKMRVRAKQLRLLSGRVLSTECGVGFLKHYSQTTANSNCGILWPLSSS